MIAGLADGGRVLNEPRYIQAARDAVDFILASMRTKDGGLLRTYRGGQAKITGFFEDYSFLIRGLMALHRATGESQFVNLAAELAADAKQRFRDPLSGGYFDAPAGHDELFVRAKTTYDGATPAGVTVMLHNLLDLHEATGRREFLDDAAATLSFLSQRIRSAPVASPLAAAALHRFTEKYPQRLVGGSFADPVRPPGVEPVRISVDRSDVRLRQGATTDVRVTLNIDEGYHINAHEPSGSGHLSDLNLVALAIEPVGAGIELEADYPTGELYRGPLFDAELRVHKREVTVPVRIKRTGPLRGTVALMAVYQVCTDRVCLAPQRVLLPVRIQVE